MPRVSDSVGLIYSSELSFVMSLKGEALSVGSGTTLRTTLVF